MKVSRLIQAGLFISLLTGQACKNQDTQPCTLPHQVTADSQCYSGKGLQLTASDYGDRPLSFTWEIYATKDTSKTFGWNLKDEKIKMIAANNFVVPDSLVTNYQRLIVNVSANCDGLLKSSTYYGFVKKQSSTSNCVTWVVQTL